MSYAFHSRTTPCLHELCPCAYLTIRLTQSLCQNRMLTSAAHHQVRVPDNCWTCGHARHWTRSCQSVLCSCGHQSDPHSQDFGASLQCHPLQAGSRAVHPSASCGHPGSCHGKPACLRQMLDKELMISQCMYSCYARLKVFARFKTARFMTAPLLQVLSVTHLQKKSSLLNAWYNSCSILSSALALLV